MRTITDYGHSVDFSRVLQGAKFEYGEFFVEYLVRMEQNVLSSVIQSFLMYKPYAVIRSAVLMNTRISQSRWSIVKLRLPIYI